MQIIDMYCNDKALVTEVLTKAGFTKISETLWQRNFTQVRIK